MSTTPATAPAGEDQQSRQLSGHGGKARGIVAWSSFFFALLQSICTLLTTLSGLRLAIGVGSLAISATMAGALDRFHADWLRVPMIGLAIAGSLLNLVVLAQVRRLRNRPASRWRQQPLSSRKLRMERVQLVLAVATLALVGVEEYLHFHLRHSL